ncbi:MAG: hypothetical protein HC914_12030, partial [Chloroflexaceae bacterium]|nr:hypothetical protein [Chloroflexaceae bacterium]
TAWSYGSGQVYFAAFDLSILRAWPDEPFLWEQVLVINTPLAPAATLRWQGNNMLSNVLQLPELGLPPFGILLLYIVGYIMLIGPINFLVLRRRGRSELAWITIPVLVLVFVLGTYSVGVLIRGVRAQTFQLSIVQGFEGVEHGYATSFVGVFSPRREIYDLGFPEMTLVSTWRFDTRGNDVALLWTDSNTRINDVLVDVSGIRSFAAERAVPLDVQLESNVQQQGDRVQGTVSNRGDIPLQDAFIVYNNTVQPIGDLPPGATADVLIERALLNFPQGVQASTDGVFNRQQLLDSLFFNDGFGMSQGPFPVDPVRGSLNQRAVYLLGWTEQPVTPMTLDGSNTNLDSLSLYIVQLDSNSQ